MGVTNLWQVLEPVQVHQTLSSLKGQTLAVDLSIWVCETQCVKQMQGVVSKPYLRYIQVLIKENLFLCENHERIALITDSETYSYLCLWPDRL